MLTDPKNDLKRITLGICLLLRRSIRSREIFRNLLQLGFVKPALSKKLITIGMDLEGSEGELEGSEQETNPNCNAFQVIVGICEHSRDTQNFL